MTEIPLLRSKLVALVDDEDAPLVLAYGWRLLNKGYAQTGRVGSSWLMHRLILHRHNLLKSEPGLMVDHIDRDKLNNQKANLREVTNSLNRLNSLKLGHGNQTGEKNIHPDGLSFVVSFKRNQKLIRVGCFSKFEDAVRARDEFLKTDLGHLTALVIKTTSPSIAPTTGAS